MFPGMAPDEAYRLADELDTRLDEELHFAFDDRLGYLTQCPTNLGTGMRASLMLHLPALQERGALQQLANTVAKLGLTIRGLYGEGSRSEGAIYQLSNQVSLGISEQAAIENLKGIAAQIIREERAAREQLKKDSRFEDRVWRSLGILCTARLLTGDEFMALISNLRVGVSLGCLEGVNLDVIGGLINDVQPATLMADARRRAGTCTAGRPARAHCARAADTGAHRSGMIFPQEKEEHLCIVSKDLPKKPTQRSILRLRLPRSLGIPISAPSILCSACCARAPALPPRCSVPAA